MPFFLLVFVFQLIAGEAFYPASDAVAQAAKSTCSMQGGVWTDGNCVYGAGRSRRVLKDTESGVSRFFVGDSEAEPSNVNFGSGPDQVQSGQGGFQWLDEQGRPTSTQNSAGSLKHPYGAE